MVVAVSEPCDVFRVLKVSTIAAMADLWTFKAASDKFLSLNKVFSKTPYRGSCFRYIIAVTPLRPWLPCIFIQNQLRKWKRILLLELLPLNQSFNPSALLSFLYMEKCTERWADSRDAKRSTCVSCWPPEDLGTTPLTPDPWKERPHSDWPLPGDKLVLEKFHDPDKISECPKSACSRQPVHVSLVTSSKYMAIVLFLRSFVNRFRNC